MKTSFSATLTLLALGLTASLGLAQTDPGVTPGRVTPTAPGAPAANTTEKTTDKPLADAADKNTAQPAAAASAPATLKTGAQFATAKLEARSGSKATGTVTFIKEADGIRVTANVNGVTEGKHGFHIHERGDCSAPDASTAGAHFNPGKASHGDPKAAARHAGDLGNIDIKKDGTGTLKLKVTDPKDFSAWAEIGGKAVILHEKADDLKTQPTGDAGGRIACGVIDLSPKTSH